jgi:hypothetical protein
MHAPEPTFFSLALITKRKYFVFCELVSPHNAGAKGSWGCAHPVEKLSGRVDYPRETPSDLQGVVLLPPERRRHLGWNGCNALIGVKRN